MATFALTAQPLLAQQPPAETSQLLTQPWQSQCQPQACVAERGYIVKRGEQNQRILTLRLQRRTGSADTVLALLGPLGVRIAPGMRVDAIDGQAVTLPYVVCANIGCSAETQLSAAALAELTRTKQLSVAVQMADGNRIVVSAGLEGLEQALQQWER